MATKAQKAKAAERLERMRELAKTVSELSPARRNEIAERAGICTIEGRPLSMHNACMLVSQLGTPSIVGGFRQWKAAGRIVRKGEHGAAIWIPQKHKDAAEDTPEAERVGFRMGTVFDIAQTDELAA